jgi:large conductance mechanosensitive channel
MGIVNEFKKFALKGNVLDLAIAVVIGAAFNKIVSSLVDDIIMPPIGLIIGGVDFTALKLVMKAGPTPAETVTLNYGNFIQTIINFLIVAWAVFLLIKAINTIKEKWAKEPEKASEIPEVSTKEIELLTEIRDALVRKKID